eukprot:2323487-Pyramimonas_sp.AAC.1
MVVQIANDAGREQYRTGNPTELLREAGLAIGAKPIETECIDTSAWGIHREWSESGIQECAVHTAVNPQGGRNTRGWACADPGAKGTGHEVPKRVPNLHGRVDGPGRQCRSSDV